MQEAGQLSILFDVGGVLGGTLAGHLSDVTGASAVVSSCFVWLTIPVLWLYRTFGSASFTGAPTERGLSAGCPGPGPAPRGPRLPVGNGCGCSCVNAARTVGVPPTFPPHRAVNIVLMMVAGFFVNGPYALITTAVSADLGSSLTGGWDGRRAGWVRGEVGGKASGGHSAG